MKKFLAVICSLAVLAGGVAMFSGCGNEITIPDNRLYGICADEL